MRCEPAEFRALPLEVHSLLADVPLRDVTAIDLPGGGPARTLADVRALIDSKGGDAAGKSRRLGMMTAGNWATRALFGFRALLGKLCGWDRVEPGLAARTSYLGRMPEALAARSHIRPGKADGFFKVMYALDREMLVEARNTTVHAFLSSALVPHPTSNGYRLYWAVYVKRTSWLTPLYMAAIEPFRRFIVYPSILGRVRDAWRLRYSTGADNPAPAA
jgi:hypothetical protein